MGNCDYGTDCTDCGIRDEVTYSSWYAGGRENSGIWCFKDVELLSEYNIKCILWGLFVAITMAVVKNSIMCPCCLTEGDTQKKFCEDIGQNIGQLYVISLSIMAGYTIGVYGFDWDLFLFTKTVAYVLA